MQTGEALALRPDGSVVPIRLGIGARRPEQRSLQVCFVTDISARKQMEQAVRDSEHQLRSLIGNIPGISYRCLMQDELAGGVHQRRSRAADRVSAVRLRRP